MYFRPKTIALAAISVGACAATVESADAPRVAFDIVEERAPSRHDGADDLLTGGLGLEGLNRPAAPDDASLRTKAIHYNYRAIVDVTERGGFTRLYGPAADALKIPGTEYLARLKLPGIAHPFAVAVAIPDSFDPSEPCLFIAPSSGSRGVYGAIGTGGAAGLARGCAVVFTDKATGTGFVHLETGEGYDVALALTDDSEAMLYTVEGERPDFGPGAVAVKHAHSQDNVERFWGLATLAAGEYALDVLNRHFDDAAFDRGNTLILAVSISNGAKAAVMAAEADETGLLDGIVASEPNLAPRAAGEVYLGGKKVEGAGRAMIDYATLANVYAPCAALAPELANAPGAAASQYARPALEAWCAGLAAKGLVEGEGADAQASNAFAVMREAGFAQPTDILFHYSVAIRLWPALAVGYVNAYGRYALDERPCGAYYAYADKGAQRVATQTEKADLAAVSSGIPPVAGVDIVYAEQSPAAAFNAALCFRELWESAEGERVRAGVAEAQNSGAYGDIPVIVLHGRSDALLPVDHTSRPWVAAAKGTAPLRYYEIEGGQHFDAFLALPDLGAELTPMEAYLGPAADLMIAHLREGAPLPPSQIVRNAPRGAGPLSESHLGGIKSDPGADAIIIGDGAVRIPE